MRITEVQIVPIQAKDGLLAFASCIVDSNFFIGCIGIMTKLSGGYRLVYPTRKVAGVSLNVYYPINRNVANTIEKAILSTFEKVANNDRHSNPQTH